MQTSLHSWYFSFSWQIFVSFVSILCRSCVRTVRFLWMSPTPGFCLETTIAYALHSSWYIRTRIHCEIEDYRERSMPYIFYCNRERVNNYSYCQWRLLMSRVFRNDHLFSKITVVKIIVIVYIPLISSKIYGTNPRQLFPSLILMNETKCFVRKSKVAILVYM